MKGLFTSAIVMASVALSGCQLTEEEKEKLEQAGVDLSQLADQIIITNPANSSEVSTSMVVVRADIPTSANAQAVTLFVDGIEIASDNNGSPWEINWPAYYYADGNLHTLLLKTTTGEGVEVRNNQQFQLTVLEEANEALEFNGGLNGLEIQDEDSLSISFKTFPAATKYQVSYADKVIETVDSQLELTGLGIGSHEVRYRVIYDYSENTSLIGPWSTAATFQVLNPILPDLEPPFVTESATGHQVTLSWQAIDDGDTYEVYWGAEGAQELLATTTESSFLIPSVNEGFYEWSLKRINSVAQQSQLTSAQILKVGDFKGPEVLPVLNDPVVEFKDGGYQVTFSWEAVSEGDQYEVFWGKNGEILGSAAITNEISYVLSDQALGAYDWAIQRTNVVGQVSVKSNAELLNLGVFKKQFGGSSNDYPKQLIATQDGGVVILANTYSQGDGQNGDDWFIKLDANGNTEWEYVLNRAGSSRLRDIRELSDGSIYAVGSSGYSDNPKGYGVKLSGQTVTDNRILWELDYSNPEMIKQVFKSLTELNNNLYAVVYEVGCSDDDASIDCPKIHNKLYEFDTNSGELIRKVDIPQPNGALLDGLGYLSTTSNNQLLLACSAKSVTEPENSFMAGSCILNFDKDGHLNWSWNSVGQYSFLNGRYAVEAPWGDYFLSGQHQFDGLPLAAFNESGSEIGTYSASGGYSNWGGTLAFTDDKILRLVSGRDSDYPELWSTTRSGFTEITKVFRELKYDHSSPYSLVNSKDGGLFLLFSEDQDGYSNKDIIILKTDINGNF